METEGMKKLLFLFFGLYLGAMGYLYVTQERQIFPGFAQTSDENSLSKVSLRVDEGIFLDGRQKFSLEKEAPLLLYFGGNADDATAFALHVKELKGYEILSFNYRGFGNSGGKPSEKALFEDALKIYDTYAKGRKVVLVGRSLGSGVATYVASKRESVGLVLITPYDSIVSMGQQKYPYFPIAWLLKHSFETVRYIPSITAPIAIIEVENDTTIPRYHLEKLLAMLPKPPLHVRLSNATHGDVLKHPNFTHELQTLLGKIRE
jgi:pimeloyl-ACP methyl ester carboxylesterase